MKRIFLVASLGPLIAFGADAPSTASKGPAQAEVKNPVKETELATVILTQKATERLGVATAPAEKKVIRQDRFYGGEIMLPLATGPGTEGLVALAPPQNPAELLKLAELQAAAESELSQTQVKLDAAKLALERAEKLLANQTGSERAVEEARAVFDLAKSAREHAANRRALLGPGFADTLDGKHWWARVAVLGADTRELDPKADAVIIPLGSKEGIPAKRIAGAPPTANAIAGTVDWYFAIEDLDRHRRPGERVEVRIPLEGAGNERLVVPWAAVLHDIHGGQWVYEMTGPTTFVRRRVQVARVAGPDAILATGPALGSKIVTTGAAELFGIEFGPGK